MADDADLRHKLAAEIAGEQCQGIVTLQIAWIILQAIMLMRRGCGHKSPAKALRRVQRRRVVDTVMLKSLIRQSGYTGDVIALSKKIRGRADTLTLEELEELWQLS